MVIKHTLAVLAILVMPLFAGGCANWFCGKQPIKFNVTVSLDPSMREFLGSRKLQVDLVGVNESNNPMWQSYSMTKYWEPNDPLRASAFANGNIHTMIFDPAKPAPQTLKIDNPIWDKWLKDGANRLYVLAFLPGVIQDADGNQDPRRKIEPLACYRWLARDNKIDIRIERSGVNTISQLRPEH